MIWMMMWDGHCSVVIRCYHGGRDVDDTMIPSRRIVSMMLPTWLWMGPSMSWILPMRRNFDDGGYSASVASVSLLLDGMMMRKVLKVEGCS